MNRIPTLAPAVPFNKDEFPRSTKIRGVKLEFVRFDPDRPVEAYGQDHVPDGQKVYQWETRVIIPTAEQAQELANQHLRVKKHDDGTFSMNLKRKTLNSKGQQNQPVRVVDCGNPATKQPPQDFKEVNTIGNGTIANLSVYQFHYVTNGGGISEVLSAVQIVDLVPYSNSGTSDFGAEEGFSQNVIEETNDDEIDF